MILRTYYLAHARRADPDEVLSVRVAVRRALLERLGSPVHVLTGREFFRKHWSRFSRDYGRMAHWLAQGAPGAKGRGLHGVVVPDEVVGAFTKLLIARIAGQPRPMPVLFWTGSELHRVVSISDYDPGEDGDPWKEAARLEHAPLDNRPLHDRK